jgi:hypothetical protein
MAHLRRRLRDWGDGAVNASGAFELRFGWVLAGELAEHLIVGAAERLHAGVVTAFDDAIEVVDRTLAAGCGFH